MSERIDQPMRRAPLLAEKLADILRQKIASGRFKAGEKLPTERELSETYGVSRVTVRDALGRLKHDGIIVSRQGSGGFVAKTGAPTLRLHIAPADAKELRDLVELLSAVRSAASAHAAARRTSAQLATIARFYHAIELAIEEGRPGEEEDLAFHRAIMDAAANPLFNSILEFLDGRMREFVRAARSNSRSLGLTSQVQAEHREMLDAIAACDPEGARKAAERHLANALKRLGVATPARHAGRKGAGREESGGSCHCKK